MAVTSAESSLPMQTGPDLYPTVGKKELNREDFLTLFITQLQYQDPLKPMDSYEMATQLAQFSSMEATMKMSDNIEELLAYQTSQNNLQLMSLLDSEVVAYGNMMAVNDGDVKTTEFVLNDAAETCVVEIYDTADNIVRSIDMGAVGSGMFELDWDGKDSLDDPVKDGAYYYIVKAKNIAGEEVDVDYRTTGKVTGLEYESGTALLTVDDYIQISVSDVLKVQQEDN